FPVQRHAAFPTVIETLKSRAVFVCSTSAPPQLRRALGQLPKAWLKRAPLPAFQIGRRVVSRGRSRSEERRGAVPAERCDGKVDEICRWDTWSRRRYHEKEWLEGRARGQQLCANRRG